MLRLMYITNDPVIGKIAQKSGVDWIFIDLEYIGKKDRQSNRNTVISAHTIEDIIRMRSVIDKSQLLVRVNPLGKWSKKEIDESISAGADIIMLPFFKNKKEVEEFIYLVDKRVKTCLLIETMSAVNSIDEILEVKGIDYVHIGLNDIHIERKTSFMFEFLADGYVDTLANKIKNKNIPFGFGGIAYIGSDLLPKAEDIIADHYRLGSTSVILSRSFVNSSNVGDYDMFEEEFISKVENIRDLEFKLRDKGKSFFEENKLIVRRDTYKIRDLIKSKGV